MLSPVLLLKTPNTTTSPRFSKHSTGSRYPNKLNTKQYHSHTTYFNPLNPLTSVSCSTIQPTSFNPFLFHSNTGTATLPPFCYIVIKICQSPHGHTCSCPTSLEQPPASIATYI